MKRWFTLSLSAAVVMTLVGADGAVKGIHVPTGHVGQLGTDLAGVFGTGTTAVRGDGGTYGIYGDGGSYGVYGISKSYGVCGVAQHTGVIGQGLQYGVWASGDVNGVYGQGPKGVHGWTYSADGAGVFGESSAPACVQGSPTCIGVIGQANGGWCTVGVKGLALHGGTAVFAHAEDGYGLKAYGSPAGYFYGSVDVVGVLSKSAGSFKIDHPLDPENKYLSHSFVESPDMKNVYDGVIVLDPRGEAVVKLPDWFEALNKDFRYQLTCIGQHAPVYIAEEIKDNQFRIAGGYADMKVSWQVTGIRKDPYAVAHPIPVEHAKPPQEQGRYLHPDAYGVSPELGIDTERRVQMKQR